MVSVAPSHRANGGPAVAMFQGEFVGMVRQAMFAMSS